MREMVDYVTDNFNTVHLCGLRWEANSRLLAVSPGLLVKDDPVTTFPVTLQTDILDYLKILVCLHNCRIWSTSWPRSCSARW